MLTLQALTYLKDPEWRAHLELCHRNPGTLKEPGAMLNQSRDPINYGEVHTSASLTARTVESFDHQEKYFSPYRRTITSYFKYISIADLCSDLWLDKKIYFCSLGNKKNTRETINVSTIAVIHYFYYWESF